MRHLRKTKIICTIGPASDSKTTIKKLIKAGMNVARINCSHGNLEQRKSIVARLKKVREKLNVPLAIMLDTKGPEFRLGVFENREVVLEDGQTFTLTVDDVIGDNKIVSVSYKNLHNILKPGNMVLVNDGLTKLKVTEIKDHNIICKTIVGGAISNKKSLSFPDINIPIEYISESDKQDIIFCAENSIEYIACSFVSNAEDVKSVRNLLDNHNGQDVQLLAKIENQSGINNIEEISEYCSGIMVARGDLGVEVSFDKLPAIQKRIIRKCRKLGKVAITCTEMLESMIYNPRPTRAEISDVANAVYDGSTAVMLSGETAAGKYPVETVKTMSKIIRSTEKLAYKNTDLINAPVVSDRTVDAIAHATCTIASDVKSETILNFTESGYTPKLISNFRPSANIFVVSYNNKYFHKLSLYFGVIPIFADNKLEFSDLVKTSLNTIVKIKKLDTGDKIVICSGWNEDKIGYTNFIRVHKI